jgi:PST family polysaccharide transporter
MDARTGELLRAARRGLGWTLGSQFGSLAIRVGSTLVLARLLTPRDFGLAGMALVFSGLASVVFEFGLGTALVQRSSIDEADRSTAFWTNVGLGAACTVAGIALAGPVASLYGEPEVEALFAVLSVGFLLTALGATQSALLTRALEFRALELSALIGVVAGAAVAVALAAAGYGPWAIVAQQLAMSGVTIALLWRWSPWRPRFMFLSASLRDLGGFSSKLFGARLAFYLYRNADNFLIGRFVGAAPLGAYSVAYNVVLMPFNRIVDPIRSVAFPTLARIQNDRKRVAEAWLRATRVVAAVFLPLMLGLVVAAPEFVPVVLGKQWEDAIPLLQILAFAGVLQSLAALNSVVLPVLDRAGTLFRFSLITVAASLAGFAAGLHWGVIGVAAGYLAANLLVVPLYTLMTSRALGLPFLALPRAVAGVAEAALGMLACMLAVRLLLAGSELSDAARLALLVLAGAVSFLPLCAWRAPTVPAELRSLLRRTAAAARLPA